LNLKWELGETRRRRSAFLPTCIGSSLLKVIRMKGKVMGVILRDCQSLLLLHYEAPRLKDGSKYSDLADFKIVMS
jgi:hypothetical protein